MLQLGPGVVQINKYLFKKNSQENNGYVSHMSESSLRNWLSLCRIGVRLANPWCRLGADDSTQCFTSSPQMLLTLPPVNICLPDSADADQSYHLFVMVVCQVTSGLSHKDRLMGWELAHPKLQTGRPAGWHKPGTLRREAKASFDHGAPFTAHLLPALHFPIIMGPLPRSQTAYE